jgi:hypothetical protein
MSATRIAASFRVSLTALLPKQPDRRVAVAGAWLRFHAALEEGVEAGSAALRVNWPVYPRRVDHNTVMEGGIDKRAEAFASGPVRRRPNDLVAIALAGPAQGVELVDHGLQAAIATRAR